MMKYNYLRITIENVKNYIIDNIDLNGYDCDRYELEEHLHDTLWIEDSVTGNASGSYTFNSYKAAENLAYNWDLLGEALDAFGCDENPIKKGPEWCDVTIRCYLLGSAIAIALDEMGI